MIRTLCARFGVWLLSQEHPGLSNLVLEERFELSRPKALIPETSVSSSYTTPAWSTDPDSNRIRAGLQSAASTASAFSAQKTTNKLWLGRKDSNLRTLGSEPSAVAAVLLPNMCFWLRDSVSSRALQGFNLALSPD